MLETGVFSRVKFLTPPRQRELHGLPAVVVKEIHKIADVEGKLYDPLEVGFGPVEEQVWALRTYAPRSLMERIPPFELVYHRDSRYPQGERLEIHMEYVHGRLISQMDQSCMPSAAYKDLATILNGSAVMARRVYEHHGVAVFPDILGGHKYAHEKFMNGILTDEGRVKMVDITPPIGMNPQKVGRRSRSFSRKLRTAARETGAPLVMEAAEDLIAAYSLS